jgi:hypothetical protein
MDESLKIYIERLSGLPPRERLAEWRAIQDPDLQRQVSEALPPKVHAEMLAESLCENLNRNVREREARKRGHKAA